MSPLLVTGASGFLGQVICHEAQKTHQTHGLYFQNQVREENTFFHRCDLKNENAVQKIITEIKPKAIIHTAAVSDANYCQQNISSTKKINVDASLYLAKFAAGLNIPFVFTSSDLVFDGKNGNYNENDHPNPVSIYGEQKELAEEKIIEMNPQALICRLPLMIGKGRNSQRGYLNNFLFQIKNGQTQKLFSDEYRSVADVISIAKAILQFSEKQRGILHLGGKQKLSRFELGEIMVRTLQLNDAKITSVKQQEVKMAAPRPADVSLDSSKAYNLGYRPAFVVDALNDILKQIN